jgi:hypothetical protein
MGTMIECGVGKTGLSCFAMPDTARQAGGRHTKGRGFGIAARSRSRCSAPRAVPGISFRVILTTGLVALYLAGCLAALSLLLSIWSPSV